MKKTLLFLLLLSSLSVFSQIEDAWVYFNDKPNSAIFLSNPLTMLSQRSLDRRAVQGISLSIQDTPIHQPYINQVASTAGITVLAKSKWLNCLHVRGSQADINALTALNFVANIVWAHKSWNRTTNQQPKIIPVHKQFATAVNFNYGTSANQVQMLNGHLLHQQNYTGMGKVIAVLDSGFPNVNTVQSFQRLMTNNQILGGYDFVNKNTNYFSGHYHGTLVLSCMGGYVNNQLVGTAPDASYYLYITEDVASENPVEESYWVEAAEEADRVGADIITSSLGYVDYDNPSYTHSYTDMTGNKNFASKGANIAFTKGIVVLASAGNSGTANIPTIGVPAEATNVLAVGAVQSNRTYANFSSIGPTFDGRIKPDIMAQGQNSVLSDTNGNIATANGTSFSCPIMAGMIASFWQAVPNLNAQQIVNFVRQASDRYTFPDSQYGYGIPNFQQALNTALNINNLTISDFQIQQIRSNNSLRIVFPNNFKNVTLALYNTIGQQVLAATPIISYQNIDLSALATGVYLYKIDSDGTTKTGKIIN